MSIGEKLAAVMAACRYMAKDGRNDFQRYDYTTAASMFGKICEGEIKGFNPLTGEPILGEKISDTVVGYIAYMRLVNGFEKSLFMFKAEIELFEIITDLERLRRNLA